MSDLERSRSNEIKAHYVIQEYRKIVRDLFPSTLSIDAYVTLFSSLFHVYQDISNRKMDPESIREQYINCGSAAALTAIWWALQFPHLTPVFLVENVAETGSVKSSAHCHIALPHEENISATDALKQYHDPNRTRDDITLLDWTPRSYMKRTNPQNMASVLPITGLVPFVTNRIAVLGLPKKYSTKNGSLAPTASSRA